eukprot:gene6783-10400_t
MRHELPDISRCAASDGGDRKRGRRRDCGSLVKLGTFRQASASSGNNRRLHDTLASHRSNAINNVALSSLLRAKAGGPPGMPSPSLCHDPRYYGMLSYLRSATGQVDETHLDLSHCPLSTSDFVVLKSVLAGHPNVASIDLSHTTLSTVASRDLLEMVKANPDVINVKLDNTRIPPATAQALADQLQANRQRAAQRLVLREKQGNALRKRRHKAAFDRTYSHMIAAEIADCQAIEDDEQAQRKLLIRLYQDAHKKAVRSEARRQKRAMKQAAMAYLVAEEKMLRQMIDAAEMAEALLLVQVQEDAQARILHKDVEASVSVLKRSEVAGWGSGKRAEKGRKAAEHNARQVLETEYCGTKDKIVAEEYRVLNEEFVPYEQQRRTEALDAQAEREDKEARELWLKEKAAKELHEKELWLKRQQELEEDMRRSQLQKQRDVVLNEEHNVRRSSIGDSDSLMQHMLWIEKADRLVSRCVAQLASLEEERVQLVASPPVVELDLTAMQNMPRKYFLGDQVPAPIANTATARITVPDNFAASLAAVEKSIRTAVKDVKDAQEAALKEFTKMSNRHEAECKKLISAFFRQDVQDTSFNQEDADWASTSQSLFLKQPVAGSPMSPVDGAGFVSVRHPQELAPITSIFVAAIVIYTLAVPKTGFKKLKGRLKDVSRGQAKQMPVNSIYRPVHARDIEPADEVEREKVLVKGGSLTVSAFDDASEADLFFADLPPGMGFSKNGPSTQPQSPPRNIKRGLSMRSQRRDLSFPCERRLKITLRLQFAPSAHVPPTVTDHVSWASMILLPPYISQESDTERLTYEEDTPPDACKPCAGLCVHTAVNVLRVRGQYSFSPTSFTNFTLRFHFVEGYTSEDVILFSFSENLYVRTTERPEFEPAASSSSAHTAFGNVAKLLDATSAMRQKPSALKSIPSESSVIWLEDRDLSDQPVAIGEVVKGQLLSVSRPTKPFGDNSVVDIAWKSSHVDAGVLQAFLKRIRYGNFSQDPVPGDRVVRVSIIDPYGNACSTQVTVAVVAQDDPTTMSLATAKVTYRPITSISTPTSLRSYLSQPMVRPFWGVKVQDVDTVNFSGGYAEATLNATQQQDLLLLAAPIITDASVSSSIDSIHILSLEDATEFPSMFATSRRNNTSAFTNSVFANSEDNDDEDLESSLERSPNRAYFVIVEGVPIARVEKGMLWDPATGRNGLEDVVQLAQKTEQAGHSEDSGMVSIHFLENGAATIACCAPVLELVAFTSLALKPRDGDRMVDVVLQTGIGCKPGEAVEALLDLEFDSALTDTVTVRVGQELFDVSQPMQQYREGSGQVRLAPFEVSSQASEFNRGYLIVEMLEGHTGNDFLAIRDSSADLRFVKREDGCWDNPVDDDLLASTIRDPPPMPTFSESTPTTAPPQLPLPSFGQPECERRPSLLSTSHPVSPVFPSSRPRLKSIAKVGKEPLVATPVRTEPVSPLTKHVQQQKAILPFFSTTATKCGVAVKDKMMGKANRMHRANLALRELCLHQARLAAWKNLLKIDGGLPPAGEGEGPDSRMLSWDVHLAGNNVGVLVTYAAANTWLCLIFNSRASVSKKEVLSLLRCITYANHASDFSILEKVVKVTLSDGQQCSTEAIVHIEVQEVDDVTEIIVKQPRIIYRQGFHDCLPLAPIGQAWLQDPDTAWFDGGHISCELAAGHSKSDILSFMPVSEQKRSREALATSCHEDFILNLADLPFLQYTPNTDPASPSESPGDGTITFHETGVVVGYITFPKCSAQWAPSNNIRITFVKASETPTVSILIATLVLNCITYTSSQEKSQMGSSRSYVLHIADGVNPQSGKAKITVDAYSPLLVIAHPKQPVQFKYAEDLPLRTNLDGLVILFPKTIVNWVTEKKGSPLVTAGSIVVQCTAGFQQGDAIVVKKETSVKDGVLSVAKEPAGKMVSHTPDKVHIEITTVCRMRTKQVQELIRSFAFRPAADGGTRVVRFLITDSLGFEAEGFITLLK